MVNNEVSYLNELGSFEGYTGDNCINCGKNRVQFYSSGKLICGECGFDQEEKDYDYAYCYYFDV